MTQQIDEIAAEFLDYLSTNPSSIWDFRKHKSGWGWNVLSLNPLPEDSTRFNGCLIGEGIKQEDFLLVTSKEAEYLLQVEQSKYEANPTDFAFVKVAAKCKWTKAFEEDSQIATYIRNR